MEIYVSHGSLVLIAGNPNTFQINKGGKFLEISVVLRQWESIACNLVLNSELKT